MCVYLCVCGCVRVFVNVCVSVCMCVSAISILFSGLGDDLIHYHHYY